MNAIASHDAIGYSNVLQLELHSLVLHVTPVERLSDKAVRSAPWRFGTTLYGWRWSVVMGAG